MRILVDVMYTYVWTYFLIVFFRPFYNKVFDMLTTIKNINGVELGTYDMHLSTIYFLSMLFISIVIINVFFIRKYKLYNIIMAISFILFILSTVIPTSFSMVFYLFISLYVSVHIKLYIVFIILIVFTFIKLKFFNKKLY